MSSSNSSNTNKSISKKKPGPKAGSKRDPHSHRPGPKKLMDQPLLQQQRLDMMKSFQSPSSSSNSMPGIEQAYTDVETVDEEQVT